MHIILRYYSIQHLWNLTGIFTETVFSLYVTQYLLEIAFELKVFCVFDGLLPSRKEINSFFDSKVLFLEFIHPINVIFFHFFFLCENFFIIIFDWKQINYVPQRIIQFDERKWKKYRKIKMQKIIWKLKLFWCFVQRISTIEKRKNERAQLNGPLNSWKWRERKIP